MPLRRESEPPHGHDGLDPALAETLVGLTLTTVAVSILVHGISVTPLMKLHEKRQDRLE